MGTGNLFLASTWVEKIFPALYMQAGGEAENSAKYKAVGLGSRGPVRHPDSYLDRAWIWCFRKGFLLLFGRKKEKWVFRDDVGEEYN